MDSSWVRLPYYDESREDAIVWYTKVRSGVSEITIFQIWRRIKTSNICVCSLHAVKVGRLLIKEQNCYHGVRVALK